LKNGCRMDSLHNKNVGARQIWCSMRTAISFGETSGPDAGFRGKAKSDERVIMWGTRGSIWIKSQKKESVASKLWSTPGKFVL